MLVLKPPKPKPLESAKSILAVSARVPARRQSGSIERDRLILGWTKLPAICRIVATASMTEAAHKQCPVNALVALTQVRVNDCPSARRKERSSVRSPSADQVPCAFT